MFFESLGGSLIHSRATDPRIVERVCRPTTRCARSASRPTRSAPATSRRSPNTAILAIRDAQPAAMRGTAVQAPVLEANGQSRIGRFGWKSQHASLVSFSADAYLNEMGITSPLLPEENTSSGRNVGFGTEYDPVKDPEDDGTDVRAFANFMRATKAPSRGDITADVLAGETVFNQIGCADLPRRRRTGRRRPARRSTAATSSCRPRSATRSSIRTAISCCTTSAPATAFRSARDLASTANQMRTAPLWALRTRSRLMHDGLTFTLREAIERHGGQAARVTNAYEASSDSDKKMLEAFLDSL